MALTYVQIMAAGLSRAQARHLVHHPYSLPATTIKRGTSGRREASFSFTDLAPRLAAYGLSPAVIAALAITSTEFDPNTMEYNDE